MTTVVEIDKSKAVMMIISLLDNTSHNADDVLSSVKEELHMRKLRNVLSTSEVK